MGKLGLKSEDYKKRLGCYLESSEAMTLIIKCIKVKGKECLKGV